MNIQYRNLALWKCAASLMIGIQSLFGLSGDRRSGILISLILISSYLSDFHKAYNQSSTWFTIRAWYGTRPRIHHHSLSLFFCVITDCGNIPSSEKAPDQIRLLALQISISAQCFWIFRLGWNGAPRPLRSGPSFWWIRCRGHPTWSSSRTIHC